MTIRVLPENIINQISAGEVVERPSSIVKELIENSIDSDASQIELFIRGGGLESIIVQDNGSGIPSKEISLAVLRHATSKLNDDNLNIISKLGFRGEALPSIASVSETTITSRTQNDKLAIMFKVSHGEIDYQKVASREVGTTVKVTSLFQKTPARLKFLKSIKAENSLCKEIFQKIALSHPNIAFKLIINGKHLLNYSSQFNLNNSLSNRVKEVLGEKLFADCIEINSSIENYSLRGFIGLPTINRPTSSMQYLYINNRPIRDKNIFYAIKAAYSETIPKGRHPIGVLYLDLPHDLVDVNVHPSKAEVRFQNFQKIRKLILTTLKSAIAKAGFKVSSELSLDIIKKFNDANFSNQTSGIISSQNQNNKYQNFQWPELDEKLHNNDLMDNPPFAKVEENIIDREFESFPLGAAKGQLHSTYIISETKDGIILIDQHAAHERLVLEEMKENYKQGQLSSQILLIPEVINLKSIEKNILLENQEHLKKLGFEIESFGDESIIVREVPSLLGHANISNLIKDVAEELSILETQISIDDKINSIISKSACYGSVRSGRILNASEMNSLLRKMEITPNSGQCNHGRPTSIKLSLNDIEKLFGRR